MFDVVDVTIIGILLVLLGTLAYYLHGTQYKYQLVLSNYKADFTMMYMLMSDLRGMLSKFEEDSQGVTETDSRQGVG